MSIINLGSLLATTNRKIDKTVDDNLTTSNPLFYYLKKKGQLKVESGAPVYVEPIMFSDSIASGFYSSRGLIPVNGAEAVDAFTWDPKQAFSVLTITGKEKRENTAPEKIVSLVSARALAAKTQLMNIV